MIKYALSVIAAACLLCGTAEAGHGMHSDGMHSMHKMHSHGHGHMSHQRRIYRSPAVIWYWTPVRSVVRHAQPVRRTVHATRQVVRGTGAPLRAHREVNRTRVIRRSCPAGG